MPMHPEIEIIFRTAKTREEIETRLEKFRETNPGAFQESVAAVDMVDKYSPAAMDNFLQADSKSTNATFPHVSSLRLVPVPGLEASRAEIDLVWETLRADSESVEGVAAKTKELTRKVTSIEQGLGQLSFFVYSNRAKDCCSRLLPTMSYLLRDSLFSLLLEAKGKVRGVEPLFHTGEFDSQLELSRWIHDSGPRRNTPADRAALVIETLAVLCMPLSRSISIVGLDRKQRATLGADQTKARSTRIAATWNDLSNLAIREFTILRPGLNELSQLVLRADFSDWLALCLSPWALPVFLQELSLSLLEQDLPPKPRLKNARKKSSRG